MEFHHAVRQAYLALAHADVDRFIKIDASLREEKVAQEIRESLRPWLTEG